jgi:hypothetical protein
MLSILLSCGWAVALVSVIFAFIYRARAVALSDLVDKLVDEISRREKERQQLKDS